MPGYSPDQVPEPEVGDEPCRICGGVDQCDETEHAFAQEWTDWAVDLFGEEAVREASKMGRAMDRIADLVDRRRQTHGPEGAPF